MNTRVCLALVLATIAACKSDGTTGDDDTDGPAAPDRGFQVISPDITIPPNTEITYCYYFRTPNTEPMQINRWKSEMTPGSHHMIMFMTTNDVMPPGTVSSSNCGFGGGGTNVPVWTYAAQTPSADLQLPADDGAGKPLAQDIPANSAAFFQMHYLNATDDPITVHVTLDAFALAAGTPYTRTAAFVTYNQSISIPSPSTGHVESESCSVPAGLKFWMMSTHAHKQAVHTAVKDGSEMAFESSDWEHPGVAAYPAPFFEFSASNRLTYECTYNNPRTQGGPIVDGDSAATQEMCMASGYFFPATKPLFCVDSLGPF
jgi:hypothetical protein